MALQESTPDVLRAQRILIGREELTTFTALQWCSTEYLFWTGGSLQINHYSIGGLIMLSKRRAAQFGL